MEFCTTFKRSWIEVITVLECTIGVCAVGTEWYTRTVAGACFLQNVVHQHLFSSDER